MKDGQWARSPNRVSLYGQLADRVTTLEEIVEGLLSRESPQRDPRDETIEQLKAKLLELEDANDTLKDALALAEDELEAQADAHKFPASLDEKLTDYGDPAAEADLTTDDLLTSMRSDAAVTEDVVQKLSRAKRKKFTELLNVELAELQQERGGPKENLKRENEIEALLNLFARVGEM